MTLSALRYTTMQSNTQYLMFSLGIMGIKYNYKQYKHSFL